MFAVFDIGKTNKKFFVFDESFQEVHREYIHLEEAVDEDGFPCEDLPALEAWMDEKLAAAAKRFDLHFLNFSTYGASLVHLDGDGKVIAPLYNYLKPFPAELKAQFFETYGPPAAWAQATGTPVLGMLNAGWQLYWLKHRQPERFQQIAHSLHFPQYLSSRFTGEYISDYTSLGCHTGLWEMEAQAYHPWVEQEGLKSRLAPLVEAPWHRTRTLFGQKVIVGPGIHDSSAALLPYLHTNDLPFLLISTGTWSICLNPFNQSPLTETELAQDCLNFLRIDGRPVKASRLFLGHEYKQQVVALHRHFEKPYGFHHDLPYDPTRFLRIEGLPNCFSFPSFPDYHGPKQTDLSPFSDFETAYHRLVYELVKVQAKALFLAKGKTYIERVYVDGGFVNNQVFLQMLATEVSEVEIFVSDSPLGSALGAALEMASPEVPKHQVHAHFSRQHQVKPTA